MQVTCKICNDLEIITIKIYEVLKRQTFGTNGCFSSCKRSNFSRAKFTIERRGNYLWIRHHLAAGTDERRMKVEHDIDEKYHVDDTVDNQERNVLAGLVLESDVIRHHDGCVKGQTQDDPIPDRFKRAIMQ